MTGKESNREQSNIANRLHDERMLGVHLYMLFIASLTGLGIVAEGVLKGWEFWMLPLLAAGVVILWLAHIRQLFTVRVRTYLYIVYMMFAIFFYGVHTDGTYEAAALAALLLVTAVQGEREKFLIYGYIEYFLIAVIRIVSELHAKKGAPGAEALLRMFAPIVIVTMIFGVCRQIFLYRQQLQKHLDAANEAAIRKDTDMEDFLANISHEFRTPINAVTGLSSLLLKRGNQEELRSIHSAGERLAAQVEDILDYTEISGGQVMVSNDRYTVEAFIHTIIQRERGALFARGLEFVVDIDPQLPRVLYGDVGKLKKVLRHIFSNAAKFTESGGVAFRISAAPREYGINLLLEITDTGIGMSRGQIAQLSNALYQADKKRNRSTDGIGLGYSIIYGFVHEMEGFVRVDSRPGAGTSVRLSIPQRTEDDTPAVLLTGDNTVKIAVFIMPEKYSVPRVREFVSQRDENIAKGLKLQILRVSGISELTALCEEENISYVFTEQEEYETNRMFFDAISFTIRVIVAVDADHRWMGARGRILTIPRPLTLYTYIRVLNASGDSRIFYGAAAKEHPDFSGVKALIVDDEKMNLAVAAGLFAGYGLAIHTAQSGAEAIRMYEKTPYDIVFMDHMMPIMDGVECARRLRRIAQDEGRGVRIVALTANAISGAREMFLREGFDGFIAKPIDTEEFERVMRRLFRQAGEEV